MASMRVAQVASAGGEFEIVEREIPNPGPGQVRIKVRACGVCHSDSFTKLGHWPGLTFPRVPGHEIAGHVDDVGAGVTVWKKGQRVGVGWHGGHDFTCDSCRRGDFIACANAQVCGISYDGGYAEYMIAPQEAVAEMPEGLDLVEAAPLMCAGITTYNALRNSGARPGDLVAVQGIGGLGHLGIQYAARAGYRVVAISRGAANAELAAGFGAHHYIDSAAVDAVAELQKLGGARVILATAPTAKPMSALIPGLGVGGKMIVVGATTDPIEVPSIQLIGARRSVHGWPSGTARDSEDALRFAEMTGVRPKLERFPFEQVSQAYERMMSGKAVYRVVLTF